MRKLHLSNDYKFFGVCGGIGEAYDIDPTVVRIATVFLCIITGGLPLLATYFAAWVLMPKEPTR
ncbi:MAG: PspC domain-containing protein [Planctomycetota bacterium]|nr:PspC domain-containing protein [Planctomycetota bacterium]